MPFKAIGFRAIVEPFEVEKVSKGGIDLSALDEKMERNAQVMGKLVKIGEDFAKDYKPTTPQWGLKIGDIVVYAKFAGKWVKDPKTGVEQLYINDEDVVGTYEEDEDASPVVAAEET